MHRRVMYNGVFSHYPPFPYRHHGFNVYSSYGIDEPVPIANVNMSIPAYCTYRRGISYVDDPYYDYLPPIVQTNVLNDVYYHYNDHPEVIYDDEYGNAYRLSRSKVQLVDVVSKKTIRTYPSPMVVSTYRPREERIVMPQPAVVRRTSLPPYERRKAIRVLPLYHSAPHYIMTSRI